MKKISCIICSYNEAPRIGAVLQAAVNHPLIDEVIVTDDGSTDDTAKVTSSFPSVHLISYVPNRGKSYAVATALAIAKNELIMFLDADLKNLTPEDITRLAEPVLAGRADVSISVRKNSLRIFRIIGLDFISGERVVPKSIVENFSEIARLPRYGIEAWMNERIIARRLKIAIVWWKDVLNTRKTEKIGWWRGKLGDWKTNIDVFRIVSPLRVIRHNREMLSLARGVT
jgi:glycosyltransferase involved in cell wall biosynthesis